MSSLDDDGKLYRRYNNKKFNALKESIQCKLTFEEYCTLLQKAGLKSSDIGIKKYHLARFSDAGDYEIDNCRFIFYKENYREKKISDKSRLASRLNIQNFRSSLTSEELLAYRNNAVKRASEIRREYGTQPRLSDEEILRRINIIKENIKIGEWGWRVKASKLIDQTPQSVGRFYKKHLDKFNSSPQ